MFVMVTTNRLTLLQSPGMVVSFFSLHSFTVLQQSTKFEVILPVPKAEFDPANSQVL
jgi:hypothetical protein